MSNTEVNNTTTTDTIQQADHSNELKEIEFAGYKLYYDLTEAKKLVQITPNQTWQNKINEWKNSEDKSYSKYKEFRNYISSLKNRVFSEKEWEIIGKVWDEIKGIILYNTQDNTQDNFIEKFIKYTGEGAEEQDSNNKTTLFGKLRQTKDNNKKFTQPKAEMYRMLAAFNLNTFCPIVNEGYLNELIALLKEGGYITSIKNSDNKEATLSKIHWCIKSALIRKYFAAFCTNYTDATPWSVYLNLKDKEIKEILEHNQNLILTGAPGTGKTFLAKKLAAQIIGCEANQLEEEQYKDQWKFVQFHPSYDYTDFVEGLRPNYNAKANSNLSFVLQFGTFKEFCRTAANEWIEEEKEKKPKTERKKYVFVIDEINRGEISKIFGELFFAIDPGYREEENRILVDTQYQNLNTDNIDDKKNPFINGFYVPENVYIIGTMNDIDRSVESMDFAFRRRFAFYEIKATNDMLDSLKDIHIQVIVNLKEIMNELNRKILELGLTEAYQIGGAYFKKIEKFYTSKDYSKSKFKQATTKLWNLYLQGTLYEYFRGEPDDMEKLKTLKTVYFDAVENNL